MVSKMNFSLVTVSTNRSLAKTKTSFPPLVTDKETAGVFVRLFASNSTLNLLTGIPLQSIVRVPYPIPKVQIQKILQNLVIKNLACLEFIFTQELCSRTCPYFYSSLPSGNFVKRLKTHLGKITA